MKIEKTADAQLGRSFEFSLPKEWNRKEQIEYTTDYIQKIFVDKGMCAYWSIHDKGDGNPHVHLLVTMRPFNPDHSWGNKEVKDWEFVRDTDGNIVVDESHPDWWQDKKNPARHGIRIPVLDENGNQKIGDEHNRIPTTDGRLLRRMIRDARTRGTSARDTIRMWPSVRKGEEENIFPYQEEADAMFNSALIYELAVLKQYVEPLLFGIPKNCPEYTEAKRLLKFLDYFIGVSSEDIPKNSILREFIGGSCLDV